MREHTKGPWTTPRIYKDSNNVAYRIVVYGDKGGTVVHSQRVQGKERMAEANARLIAQAPNLLEALIELAGDCDIQETGCFQCRWCGREYSVMMSEDEIPELCPSDDCPGHTARQAIAKATDQ